MTPNATVVGMLGSCGVGFALAACLFSCSGSQLKPETIATISHLTPCVMEAVEKGFKGDRLVGAIAECGIRSLAVGIEAASEADAGTP